MKNILLLGVVLMISVFVFGCTNNSSDPSGDNKITGGVVIDVDVGDESPCGSLIPKEVVVSPDSYSSDNVIIVTKTKLIGFDGYEPIRHSGTSWADSTEISLVRVPYCRREGTTQNFVCDSLIYQNEYEIILKIKENNNWVGDRDKLVSNFTVVDYSCSSV